MSDLTPVTDVLVAIGALGFLVEPAPSCWTGRIIRRHPSRAIAAMLGQRRGITETALAPASATSRGGHSADSA